MLYGLKLSVERILVPYSDDFIKDYDTVDCESPHRVIDAWLKIRDAANFVEPEPCAISDLLLCHTEALLSSVERHGDVFPVARRAVGGAIMAAEAALTGNAAFALIRPPGHHAGYNFNGGFCFFNNMAVAVKKLLTEGRLESALIIDIDLHYGNGTYDIVKDDGRIAFRNISASTRAEFFDELEDALKDASSFDIVGCSAGFDTYIKDWGALLLTEDFERIGRLLASSNPHLFSILEGGYYIEDLGLNIRSYIEGLEQACS